MGLIDFLNQLYQAAGQYLSLLAIGLLVIGTFTSFLGFYWLKITRILQGFISGFIIICIISFYVNIPAPKDVFVLGMWGGLIAAVLMLVSDALAKFLMGAYTGGLLAVAGELSIISSLKPYVTFSSVALVGLLFIFIDDFILTGVISIVGAWGVVSGIALLSGMGLFNPFQLIIYPIDNLILNIVLILGWIFVAVAGMLVQFRVIKKKKNAVSALSKKEHAPEPVQEEAPSKVAVKRDIGWDALIESNTKPRKTAPFTTPPQQSETLTDSPQNPEPVIPLPEQVKRKPRKSWINPFFTDPFTTKEDLVEDKSERPPATSPFKRD